jgi:hypothetical protein
MAQCPRSDVCMLTSGTEEVNNNLGLSMATILVSLWHFCPVLVLVFCDIDCSWVHSQMLTKQGKTCRSCEMQVSNSKSLFTISNAAINRYILCLCILWAHIKNKSKLELEITRKNMVHIFDRGGAHTGLLSLCNMTMNMCHLSFDVCGLLWWDHQNSLAPITNDI